MTKPLRHVLVPPATFAVFTAAGGSAMMYYFSGGEINVSYGSFGFFLILGLPFGIYLTEELYRRVDEETAHCYEMRHPALPTRKREEITVRAIHEAPGQTQVDFFHGLTAQEWHETAVNILAADNFTVSTVGQTIRPKLIPMLLAAGYIRAVGQGRYENTRKAMPFWRELIPPPHLWDTQVERIQNIV